MINNPDPNRPLGFKLIKRFRLIIYGKLTKSWWKADKRFPVTASNLERALSTPSLVIGFLATEFKPVTFPDSSRLFSLWRTALELTIERLTMERQCVNGNWKPAASEILYSFCSPGWLLSNRIYSIPRMNRERLSGGPITGCAVFNHWTRTCYHHSNQPRATGGKVDRKSSNRLSAFSEAVQWQPYISVNSHMQIPRRTRKKSKLINRFLI